MDLYTAQIFISKLYSSTLFLKIANSKYEWSANGKIVFILEKDNTDEWHLYEYKYFGSSIRSFVSKIYVNRGVLYVKIDSSTLKNELFIQRESIVKKLNEDVQQDIIKTLIFL